MKIIENKCTGATLIEWQKLKDLQPQNLKVPYHTEKIKKSIVELGFANPFDVWINPKTNEMLIADGHGRKDVLLELIADGFQVPNKLPCTFLDNTKIKTEQEAIKYLLRVFNVKRNPIDTETLENWLEEVDLSVDDIAFDDLDLKFEVEELPTAEGSDKNKEVDIDDLNTQECKIVFKFDAVMYESVLQRLNTIKQENGHATNEAVLLSLLENYGA